MAVCSALIFYLYLIVFCFCLLVLKGNLDHSESSEIDLDEALKVDMSHTPPSASGAGGGTRAGLFRTPISGGVQSATSAHGLPRPALAVRNLMEQVKKFSCVLFVDIFKMQ